LHQNVELHNDESKEISTEWEGKKQEGNAFSSTAWSLMLRSMLRRLSIISFEYNDLLP
jgi:hypothetical protein